MRLFQTERLSKAPSLGRLVYDISPTTKNIRTIEHNNSINAFKLGGMFDRRGTNMTTTQALPVPVAQDGVC
jgi:hypothetical protein